MTIIIGNKIKTLRREQKVTQEMLAEALGVTPQAISRWESGNGYPDMELLPALADFFAVSIDELIGYRKSEREEELARIHRILAGKADLVVELVCGQPNLLKGVD